MSGSQTLPKVLVCHPWMGLAGSEVVVAWALQALKGRYEIHLCTAAGFNPERWNKVAGTSLEVADIRYIEAPRLPFVRSSGLLPYWHRRRFEEFCRSIAPAYDLCISGYNPLRFGRPALHLIGDISWYQRLSMNPAIWSSRRLTAQLLKLAHAGYEAFINQIYRKPSSHEFSSGDWFLSNSRWTLERHFQVVPKAHHELLYPPVPVDVHEPVPVKQNGKRRTFVSLGRVTPEKRVLEKIEIIGQLRAMGHDVELVVIGAVRNDAYGETLRKCAASRPDWVKLAGALYGEEKTAILRQAEFGLHACEDEAFGIAVAELVYHGCLTWVPAGSGSAEIIPDSRFHYHDSQDAVKSIDTLLRAPATELTQLRSTFRDHVFKSFLPEVFVRRFQEIVTAFCQIHGPAPKPVSLPVAQASPTSMSCSGGGQAGRPA